jgi:hypothetical protein
MAFSPRGRISGKTRPEWRRVGAQFSLAGASGRGPEIIPGQGGDKFSPAELRWGPGNSPDPWNTRTQYGPIRPITKSFLLTNVLVGGFK